MKITGTKNLKKSLVQLYIDGEEAVQVDKQSFLLSQFKVGCEIDDEDLFELIQVSSYNRAKERALYYLERKNYSKKDLSRKIETAFDKNTAIKVADKMEELGLINDLNYAQMLARDLFNLKKFGKQRVRSELYRKGIDKYIIAEVLEDEDEENDSAENIKSFLLKRYPLWEEDEKVKRRAVSALQRRGYSFREIFAVIKDLEQYE